MVKTKCEVFTRCVGYIRPVAQMNEGKSAEVQDRKKFKAGAHDECEGAA